MMLQAIEHVPAVHHGQLHVEDDRVGLELVCERKARVASDRNDSLEAALAGDLQLRAGEVRVVLDDQHDAVAVLDVVTIVADVARKKQCRVSSGWSSSCAEAGRPRCVARQHDCCLERMEACGCSGGWYWPADSVNRLPRPTSLSTWISPPRRRAISRLIESPRPVPP